MTLDLDRSRVSPDFAAASAGVPPTSPGPARARPNTTAIVPRRTLAPSERFILLLTSVRAR